MIDSLGSGKIGTATRFGWTVCTVLRVAPSRGPRILHDLRNYSRAIAIIPKFDHSPPNCDSGMALAAYKINPQSSMVAYISDYVLDSVEMGRQNLFSPYVVAAIYATDKRLQQEARKPRCRRVAVCDPLTTCAA